MKRHLKKMLEIWSCELLVDTCGRASTPSRKKGIIFQDGCLSSGIREATKTSTLTLESSKRITLIEIVIAVEDFEGGKV
jgi:hypothetical protein